VNGLRISRLRYTTVAECERCPAFDPDSTRGQVRAHVRETGHKARVTVEDVTKYEPEREAAAR
jgi:hypothetical protein